jgi:hypothetical protein
MAVVPEGRDTATKKSQSIERIRIASLFILSLLCGEQKRQTQPRVKIVPRDVADSVKRCLYRKIIMIVTNKQLQKPSETRRTANAIATAGGI